MLDTCKVCGSSWNFKYTCDYCGAIDCPVCSTCNNTDNVERVKSNPMLMKFNKERVKRFFEEYPEGYKDWWSEEQKVFPPKEEEK